MGLLKKLSRSALRLIGGGQSDNADESTLGLRICRYEEMESRALMAADLHVGAVYFEDASGDDASPDTIQVTFEGGQPGTQLTRVVIDTDKDGKGLSDGDLFFDTAASGLGSFGSSPLKVVSHDGFQVLGFTVVDGGTKVAFDLSGWDVGEKLVFSVDVDEAQFIDPETGAIDTNALVEGGEFQRSKLTASFIAPHFQDVTGSAVFFDEFNAKFAQLDAAAGNHLNLPDDAYSTGDQSFIDRTAGGAVVLNQVPLPITIAGTVFEDLNINNHQDTGDNGIPSVTLALLKFDGSQYVATGQTSITDAQGHYKFTGILPGKYRVIETQPDGYFSVGAQAGTVNGVTDGAVFNSDVITDIALLGGDDSIRNDFAEAKPASIRGRVHVDNNDNCIQDPGEPGIAGVLIELLDAQGKVVATTTTDANGDYKFENLAPGTYGVHEKQPVGYFDSGETPGSVGGVVSADDTITSIFLGSGVAAVHYDFCELLPASISGRVHVDNNDNCIQDSGEPGIAGVKVHLLDSTGKIIATTLTDASGDYKFENLAPGTYGVFEEQPAGYFDSGEMPGSAGGAVTANDKITGAVLGSGVHATDYNFCELLPASISGRVHVDLDDDCIQDEGETGIAGVTIKLLDENGNVIATTLTDANGDYKFENLKPGKYGVLEEQPVGYFDGGEMPGSAGGVVSANDKITGAVLGSGVHAVDYNFCELLPASISGRVHVDLDGDCMQDEGEPPIAGVKISLLDESGKVIATTFTDANGDYKFDNLKPGKYGVFEEQPAGYFDSGEMAGSAGGSVTANDKITGAALGSGVDAVDYNFCELLPASISGHVHADIDGDCMQDEGEPSIAGVTIQLLDASGKVIGTTKTDANGDYKFDNLAPGTYGVREIQPAGYFDSGESAGSEGGEVSDDLITKITLGSGVNAVHYDFCELLPASISGHVYADLNGDCMEDEGEPPIAGVTIHLLDANGNVIGTTLTDSNGDYRFDNLAPGVYGVREIQPVGYFDGGEAAGSAGGVVSDDQIVGVALGSGVAAVHYDFCELLPASIQGHIHLDNNDDCMQQEDEPDLAGVKVLLIDGEGDLLAETLTDEHGNYKFTGLAPGKYRVQEVQPLMYFDGGDSVGSEGGNNDTNDLITDIVLAAGVNATHYDFCELPPGSISGYVFQDGPPIQAPNGTPINVADYRDGKLTPDDVRLGGVTLELRDGVTGQPILGSRALDGTYDPNKPIRVKTNAAGYFEFINLAKGNYAVFEVQPDGFIDSIDTPGSLGGIAVNPSESVPEAILEELTVPHNNDAILRITLFAGEHSVENNFSEVVTEQFFFFRQDPPPAPQIFNPVINIKTPDNPFVPQTYPLLVAQSYFSGSSPVLNYTWHLSVVNAGQPRAVQENIATVEMTTSAEDVAAWRALLTAGEWELSTIDAARSKGASKLAFGIRKGTPITGDFNGDGVTDLGVFLDGQWFIDLNGNGQWDEGDLWAKLGKRGDKPVTGDWDHDGKTDIGIYGPAWPGDPRAVAAEPGIPDPYNKNTKMAKNVPPPPHLAAFGVRSLKRTAQGKVRADLIDHVFYYGTPQDIPVVGDWNGDGTDTIAVFRDGNWYRDLDGDGKWSEGDTKDQYGQAGDIPVVGDFNGDGIPEMGVYRDGVWYIDTNGNHKVDDGDTVIKMGGPGDKPVVGDWDGDGKSDPGVYHEGDEAPREARRR